MELGRETFLYSRSVSNVTLSSTQTIDTAQAIFVEIMAYNGGDEPLFSQLRSIRSIPSASNRIELKANTSIAITASTLNIYNRRETKDVDGWNFNPSGITVGSATGYENNVDSTLSIFRIDLISNNIVSVAPVELLQSYSPRLLIEGNIETEPFKDWVVGFAYHSETKTQLFAFTGVELINESINLTKFSGISDLEIRIQFLSNHEITRPGVVLTKVMLEG